MKYVGSFLLAMSLTFPACALTPTTQPSGAVQSPGDAGDQTADHAGDNSGANSKDNSADPLLGKTFRSRLEGIQFNPPAGGTMIRELGTGEIVRFVYAASSWDIRVKPVISHVPLKLTSKNATGGVLEMVADQLRDNNNAQINTEEVRPMAAGGKDVGLIEAHYDAGINPIFTQVAIIKDTETHFFEVQMSSPGKAKNAPPAAADPNEAEARKMFQHMLATVEVLDREALGKEQIHRIYATNMLWVELDRKRMIGAIVPQHFMRVTQNGKDIGFIQVDERLASHAGHEGIEVILHSTVKSGGEQITDAARADPVVNGGNVIPNGLVAPAAPAAPAGAPAAPAAPAAVTNLYTKSTYFVTFDRAHEDWNTTTQIDQQVNSQLTEMANSDRVDKMRLDREKLAEHIKSGDRPKDKQPPTTQVSDYTLEVAQYAHGGHIGKQNSIELAPFYLPQAMGQMLARLLPSDPAQYLFAFYVSNQKHTMGRYVDVGKPVDVVLDGQQYHAIPIADRIGVDGIPTIHYVTKEGEWLGSVNDDSKLLVLPTDANTLAGIWKNFAICPVPPLPEEVPIVRKPTTRAVKPEADLRNDQRFK